MAEYAGISRNMPQYYKIPPVYASIDKCSYIDLKIFIITRKQKTVTTVERARASKLELA